MPQSVDEVEAPPFHATVETMVMLKTVGKTEPLPAKRHIGKGIAQRAAGIVFGIEVIRRQSGHGIDQFHALAHHLPEDRKTAVLIVQVGRELSVRFTNHWLVAVSGPLFVLPWRSCRGDSTG